MNETTGQVDDNTNPAVANQLAVPPAALELAAKNPNYLRELARKMLLVQVTKLQKQSDSPDLTVAQRLALAEFLSKIGDMQPKPNVSAQVDTGPKFSVNINMPAVVSAPGRAPMVEVMETLPTIQVPATPASAPAQAQDSNDAS